MGIIQQQTLSHSVWECKYHIVWIPKYRKKTLYGQIRQYLGEIFHNLAKQKECTIEPAFRKIIPMALKYPKSGKVKY